MIGKYYLGREYLPWVSSGSFQCRYSGWFYALFYRTLHLERYLPTKYLVSQVARGAWAHTCSRLIADKPSGWYGSQHRPQN